MPHTRISDLPHPKKQKLEKFGKQENDILFKELLDNTFLLEEGEPMQLSAPPQTESLCCKIE